MSMSRTKAGTPKSYSIVDGRLSIEEVSRALRVLDRDPDAWTKVFGQPPSDAEERPA